MRFHDLLPVFLLSLSAVNGWVQPGSMRSTASASSTDPSSCSSTALFDSRGRQKWLRKKAWLEKRGFDEKGLPLDRDVITIVGSGRIGGLFAKADEECEVVKRGDSINPDQKGPIILTTRNDALDAIIEACPENRREDLVFVQNGYLDEFLESKGLLDNTQVLLFLSVTSKGAEAVDGITSVNPEGLTAATGKHASAFAHMLELLGLKCNELSAEEYRPAMFEKLIWISTYMLVGTAKECKSVGQAGSDHKDLVEGVINELVAAVSEKEGITFADGVIERLSAYTDVVADFPCAVKEFEWRNQYFYNLGDEACPIHNGLLKECAEKGFIGFELP